MFEGLLACTDGGEVSSHGGLLVHARQAAGTCRPHPVVIRYGGTFAIATGQEPGITVAVDLTLAPILWPLTCGEEAAEGAVHRLPMVTAASVARCPARVAIGARHSFPFFCQIRLHRGAQVVFRTWGQYPQL